MGAVYTELRDLSVDDRSTAKHLPHGPGQDDAEPDVDQASHDIKARYRAPFWSSHSKNWRTLIKSGVLTAVVVLVINIITLIVVYTRFRTEDHVATIWTGDCNRVSGIVSAAHIIINIMSSLLLAASNTSMQCLAAPSRAEVDTAHARKQSFAIGIPSFRNILHVSRHKMWLWLLLGLSSLPLHTFWNSVVFQTLSTNNYYALAVAEDFLDGAAWVDPSNGTSSWELDGLWGSIQDLQRKAQNSSLTRLDRTDCIRAYGREIITSRRNVVMVTNSSDVQVAARLNVTTAPFSSLIAVYASAFTPNSTTASGQDYPSWWWMCVDDKFCALSDLSLLATDKSIPWMPGYNDEAFENLENGVSEYDCGNLGDGLIACGNQGDAEVRYCLSEEVPDRCKVSLVPTFLIIVCVCNAVKLAAYAATLRTTHRSANLVTQGDAIRSFLEAPDASLRGMCLATRTVFSNLQAGGSTFWARHWVLDDGDKVRVQASATGERKTWGAAVPGFHWWATWLLVLALIVASSQLFASIHVTIGGQIQSRAESWDLIRSQGLGEPLPSFTMGGHGGTMSILLAFFAANIPQLVLSYLYLVINNLLTIMLGMAEWTAFYASTIAQGLRVTNPVRGTNQGSTYFLTVPFRWGAPSLIFFMLLHWLTSEMVFAAKIESYNPQGQLDLGTSVTAVYYSPLIAFCVISLSAAALLVLSGIAVFKHFPTDAPLAGNHSASIAAACQPGQGESFPIGLTEMKLRWGVVRVPHSKAEIGHATFSSGVVGRLVPGMLYA
jgi:hypothetical protein